MGDTCAKIANEFDATEEELRKWNDGKTWGWTGCMLYPPIDICVSDGDPPMPAMRTGLICGPQAEKGERNPPKGTRLADMNPCPLNAYVTVNDVLYCISYILTCSAAVARNMGKWIWVLTAVRRHPHGC